VYCTGSGRSASAAKALVDLGYTDVLDLKGGINGWKKAGYAVE
jgi:rhodanese-related sulfurtransferase